METVRIFDSGLNLLAEIDNYTSLIFERKFYTYGEFQITINLNLQNAEYLQNDNIILLKSDTRNIGIIKYVTIGLNEQGESSETVVAKGYTIDFLFTQRIINTIDNITSDQESIIKHYIDSHAINPTDTNRKFNVLALATNQNRGANVEWLAQYTTLSEELNKLALNFNMGITCEYNGSDILVDILETTDKTIGSTSPVIFSYEYDNIKTQTLIDAILGYKTYAYIGGDGEGASRVVTETGTGTDIERYEAFYSISGTNTTTLQNEALKLLNEATKTYTLSGKLLDTKTFQYKTDFDLGDIVTVKNDRWGVRVDTIISAITEIYEKGVETIELCFGEDVPSLSDVINKKLVNTDSDVRR